MKLAGCVFVVFLTGCMVNPVKNKHSKNTGLTTINTSVNYIASDRTYLSKKFFSKNVFVFMPYIPGEIFGKPIMKFVYAGVVPKDLRLSFDLTKSLPNLDYNAKPLLMRWRMKGLAIYPDNTRLARIGTFAFDNNTRRPLGGGGFLDPVSKDSLILIYVNQACRITGIIDTGKKKFNHSVELPGPGFHFIRAKRLGNDYYRMEYYPPNGAADFVIFVRHTVQSI